MCKGNILKKSNSCHFRYCVPVPVKPCKIWIELENIFGYYVGNFVKILENMYGKSLEKIGKSFGEIPVSASENRNSSWDIHDFSRMQHPLILKNIYPCQRQLCKPPTFIIIIRGRLKFLTFTEQNVLNLLNLTIGIAWHYLKLLSIAWHCSTLLGIAQHCSALLGIA